MLNWKLCGSCPPVTIPGTAWEDRSLLRLGHPHQRRPGAFWVPVRASQRHIHDVLLRGEKTGKTQVLYRKLWCSCPAVTSRRSAWEDRSRLRLIRRPAVGQKRKDMVAGLADGCYLLCSDPRL